MKGIDLFCGCGGWSLAGKNNNIEMLAGIDYWQPAIDSYNSNHENGICKDLSKYKVEEFINDYKIKKLDFIFFSPPCTGFSIAGKRQKNDSRNQLYNYSIKYINYYKPKVIIMENVIGLLSMKDENGNLILNDIISQLSPLYNINIFKLYAYDYGVPQKRRRVVLVGYNKKLNKTPSCPQRISGIDISISTVLQQVVDKKYYLSEKEINGIIKKRERMKNENKGFGANFCDLDKPSFTITSRYWKDGYDCLIKQSHVDVKHTDIRRLTELELKRIQSFPDDYILKSTKKDRYIQIGNAVPPVMMTYVVKHILDEIKIIFYNK